MELPSLVLIGLLLVQVTQPYSAGTQPTSKSGDTPFSAGVPNANRTTTDGTASPGGQTPPQTIPPSQGVGSPPGLPAGLGEPAGLAKPAASAPPNAPPSASPSAPSSPSPRVAPAEVAAAAMRQPSGGALSGRPLTLVDSLLLVRDRSEQLAVTRAYWRLAAAAGEYRVAWDAAEDLRRVEAKATGASSTIHSARATALASLRSAESSVAAAQRELGEAAKLVLALVPPLPADLPYVGAYRTRFDELYARQNVGSRARLIHRALPLRRLAIEKRSEAVVSADDAVQAATEGQVDPQVAAACIAELADQRRALIGEARRYNDEIVEYVLLVYGAPLSGPSLVTMLLGTASSGQSGAPAESSPPGKPLETDRRSALPAASKVQGATFVDPPALGEWGLAPPAVGEPTLAPPRPSARDTKVAQPEGPPRDEAPRYVPRYLPRDGTTPPAGAGTRGALEPAARTALRLNLDMTGGASPMGDLASALASPDPAVRAKHLTIFFHTVAAAPGQAQEMKLTDCLRVLVAGDRRGTIDAYWLAAQRAAQCQALAQQVEWLRDLGQVALERGTQPRGALGMLRLRAARLAAEADLWDAQAELLEAQFELTRRVGRPLDSAWLLPSTPPHAGKMELPSVQALPPQLAQSAAIRRLTAAIPALSDRLRQQADAIREIDRARSSADSVYKISGPPDPLLPAIRCETLEILGFLATLTAYNQAIAEYALTVSSPTLSPDELVERLVVGK